MGGFYTFYLSLFKALVQLNETEIIKTNDKKSNGNDNGKDSKKSFQMFNST